MVDGLTCLVAVAILNQGLPPPAVSPTHLTPTQHDADAGGFVAATSSEDSARLLNPVTQWCNRM